MPFILVFNIIVVVLSVVVLLTVLGCAIIIKDNRKRNTEKSLLIVNKTEKVRGIAYIVFAILMILTLILNSIF